MILHRQSHLTGHQPKKREWSAQNRIAQRSSMQSVLTYNYSDLLKSAPKGKITDLFIRNESDVAEPGFSLKQNACRNRGRVPPVRRQKFDEQCASSCHFARSPSRGKAKCATMRRYVTRPRGMDGCFRVEASVRMRSPPVARFSVRREGTQSRLYRL